jgi:ATP synthase protein I
LEAGGDFVIVFTSDPKPMTDSRQATDMTTEGSVTIRRNSLARGLRIVVRAGALTVLAGAAATVVAALVHGPTAAGAAAVGAGLVALVVSFGTLSMHVVASAMPTASLLVALLTYVTQLAIVLMVFLAITRGDLFSATQERAWLAGSMVLATLVWTVSHLVLTARERVPYFDLPTGGEA